MGSEVRTSRSAGVSVYCKPPYCKALSVGVSLGAPESADAEEAVEEVAELLEDGALLR